MEENYCFKNKRSRESRYLCFLVFFFVLFCVALPLTTKAASLYFLPQSESVYLGDIFIVEIMIDTEIEEINACEVNIGFTPETLEIIDVSTANSILSLWAKSPFYSNEKGTLSFIGGVPRGFEGQGLIAKIIFRAVSKGSAEVASRDDSKVLLNDGKGTQVELTTTGAEFEVLSEGREAPKNEWEGELKKDTIPPEAFEVVISKEENIFDGSYFLVFSTIDKQTGVNHYEIKEGAGSWKIGSSPYLLEDQTLKNKILVKAIDKAGNERIVEVEGAPLKKLDWADILLWVILGLLMIGIAVWIVKKHSTEKTKDV